MKFYTVHNKGQAKLFNNRCLEQLTKTHPLIIWGMYLPVIGFMLYYIFTVEKFSLEQTVAVFFTGIFFWTLFEYLVHRFAFHFLAKSEKEKRVVYIIHGNHHEYPRDRERLFMPPVPSILLAAVIFSFMYFIAKLPGLQQQVFAFFPGFLVGYLLYGSIHYAIHAFNPPFKWMKPLWRNHHLHHYKEEEKGFGVSSTLWDHVFDTMFDLKKEKEDKEKVGELMFTAKSPKKNLQEY